KPGRPERSAARPGPLRQAPHAPPPPPVQDSRPALSRPPQSASLRCAAFPSAAGIHHPLSRGAPVSVAANPTGSNPRPTAAGVRATLEVGWYSSCQAPCQKSRQNDPQAHTRAIASTTPSAVMIHRPDTVDEVAPDGCAGRPCREIISNCAFLRAMCGGPADVLARQEFFLYAKCAPRIRSAPDSLCKELPRCPSLCASVL